MCVVRNQLRGPLGVVVPRDDERERRVDRRAACGREEEDAAVVAALENHDRLPPCCDARERQREQVRLGARVAEPHELERLEPLAQGAREHYLVAVRRTEHDSVVERLADRSQDHGMRMAVEAGGVLAEEIHVLVSIRVDEARPVAAHDRQRERRHVNDGARIPAGHHLGPLLVQPARFGIPVGVPAFCLRNEAGHTCGDRLDHGPAT